jgi:pimeloyl-ACP methyl ester carboxylesterase
MTLRRPEDFPHYNADLEGIRLHYVREGSQDRPAILLCHGWPGFGALGMDRSGDALVQQVHDRIRP